jgi:hypothetical protein
MYIIIYTYRMIITIYAGILFFILCYTISNKISKKTILIRTIIFTVIFYWTYGIIKKLYKDYTPFYYNEGLVMNGTATIPSSIIGAYSFNANLNVSMNGNTTIVPLHIEGNSITNAISITVSDEVMNTVNGQ